MPKQKNTDKPFTHPHAQVALMDVAANTMVKKVAKMILKKVAHDIESSLTRELDTVAATTDDLDEVVLYVTEFADAVTAKLIEVSEATLTQFVWNGDPSASAIHGIATRVRQPYVTAEAPPANAITPPPFATPISTKDQVAPHTFIPPAIGQVRPVPPPFILSMPAPAPAVAAPKATPASVMTVSDANPPDQATIEATSADAGKRVYIKNDRKTDTGESAQVTDMTNGNHNAEILTDSGSGKVMGSAVGTVAPPPFIPPAPLNDFAAAQPFPFALPSPKMPEAPRWRYDPNTSTPTPKAM